MKTIPLPGTSLAVSELGLGTSHFGTHTDRETAFAVMDRWAACGGSLIDTAHIYGAAKAAQNSPSEEVIGQWLRSRGLRDKIILCTKGAHPDPRPITRRAGRPRLDPGEWQKDLEKSLSSLQTETIDLYFLHRDDPSVPVSVLIDALEDNVKAGKIRYYGCSNWTAARMKEAAQYAAGKGYKGFVCDQLPAPAAFMNPLFLNGSGMVCLEGDILRYHQESKIPVMSAMSLCNGYFHKLLAGKKVPFFPKFVYDIPKNRPLTQKLKELEQEGFPLSAVLLQFIRSWDFPACALIGFSSVSQLDSLLADYAVPVPPEVLEQLHRLRSDSE